MQAKKDQMIARARTAKTSQKVNDMLSSMTGTTSMDAFERMKEKVRTVVNTGRAGLAGSLFMHVMIATHSVRRSHVPPTCTTTACLLAQQTHQVEMLESKAEVAGQIAGTSDTSLEGKFKLLGEASAVDDELAKMKGLLGKGTAGFLPPGQEVDKELEALRAEMDRQQ